MLKIEVKRPDDSEDPCLIDICMTLEGLRSLLKQLAWLETQRTDHIHLFSEDWGGHDLTVDPNSKTGIPIHQANIYIVDSWPQFQNQDRESPCNKGAP